MSHTARMKFAVAVMCFVSLGCGGNAGNLPALGTVTGVVTLDGEPLDQAVVEFRTETSRPSTGITDSTGRYELKFDEHNKGAAVGAHTVKISTRLNPANDKNDKIPKRYNEESDLKANVVKGENEFDFELTSK